MDSSSLCFLGTVASSASNKHGRRDSRRNHNHSKMERKWQQFFEDPAQWSDNRASKKSRKDPDFVHVFTWEGLWIDSCSSPSWVPIKLQSLGDRSKPLGDEEALKLYSSLREQGSSCGISILLAALKACGNLKQLQLGIEIHSRLDCDEANDQFVASALVAMYSACGDLQSARLVFDGIVSPDLVVWNAMIKAYVQGGDGDRALELFTRMGKTGVDPDGRTFVAALNACASLTEKAGSVDEILETGRRIHARVAERRLDSEDVFVATSLIDMYAKCGRMEEACRVFESVDSRHKADVVLLTAMIVGYTRVGEAKLALGFFWRMKKCGIRPSARAFVAALAACASVAARMSSRRSIPDDSDLDLDRRELLEKGRSIHCEIVELGLDKDRYVSSSLVELYSKCGCMIDAREVFDGIPHQERDLVLWTSLILGYAQAGQGKRALELFGSMQNAGFRPNARVFVAALAACSSLAAERERFSDEGYEILSKGLEIHAQAARTDDLSDVFVASSLLDFYSKCDESMERASRVFDEMVLHDVVSFTTMISGYAQSKRPDLAVMFFSSMKNDQHHAPNASTYAAAIKAYAKMAALDAGEELYYEACKAGLGEDSAVACAVIDLYGKCGSMADAQRVFDSATRIPSNKRDPVLWSSLISGYSHNGDAQRVFELFEAMKKEQIKPDGITFLSVLVACNHAGMADRGNELLDEMSSAEHGLKPGMEHYGCVVDMLGRANRLDEAFALVKRMPRKPSVGIWTTLLDASRKWGDLRVGRAAFEAIKEMDEGNSASYALMAETIISML